MFICCCIKGICICIEPNYWTVSNNIYKQETHLIDVMLYFALHNMELAFVNCCKQSNFRNML